MSDNLIINIYGLEVQVFDLKLEVFRRLQNDFSFFIKSNYPVGKTLKILVKDKEIIFPKNLVASTQSQNSITYDVGEIRYNDYYGQAQTMFDYKTEICEIFSLDSEFLYEIIYLIILSRSGKYMDEVGLHKVHACGVKINDKNILLMMDSKGGKTTTFLELLRDQSIGIISDDSPVISREGEISAFPMRVGVENKEPFISKFPYLKENDFYIFHRKFFSKKYLLSIEKLTNKVSLGNKNILIQGHRSTYEKPVLKKISKLKMMKNLIKNLVIGVGLPLIIEYFLKTNFFGHIRNLNIAFSRLLAALKLLRKADTYEIYLCSNPVENGIFIKEKFK